MPFSRLPGSVTTLYAELLDQALDQERLLAPGTAPPGGPVGKKIRGRRYLYWQIRKGNRSTQQYLGADTAELRADLGRRLARRAALAPERDALSRLVGMAVRGGALREETPVGEVLALLADLGLFRRGGVLVGTQAYRTYGNLLGVTLPAAAARTQDVDVAHDVEVAMASVDEPAPPVESSLGVLGFLPVPGLDPREPSTLFKVRGRELRVDFLVPAPSSSSVRPRRIPALGLSAQPLPMLGYLIEDPVAAVILSRTAVLVRVPRPARFALHKLWTAAQRPVSQHTKARKDRDQAEALLDLLAEERPDDIAEAWASLARHRSAHRLVVREQARLAAARGRGT